MKILFVEDSPTQALQVMAELNKIGECDAQHVSCLTDALNFLRTKKIDLVLLDLMLPDSSGANTVQIICNEFPDLPVVVLTGTDDDELLKVALELGAQDYIVKGEIVGELFKKAFQYSVYRKRSEEKLRRANIKLEKMVEKRTQAMLDAKEEAVLSNQAKSEFLAAMSHDLRTPLNAIMGFAEMMQIQAFGKLGDPHYEEYAIDILSSGKLLLSLINDVLDLSKIEAGKFEMVEEALDVGSFIRSSVSMLGPDSQKAEVGINMELPSDLPRLNGSRRAVVQILNNLLSNSIKFTPVGGRITVSAETGKTGSMMIRVADTGIGISRDDIAKVLNPFEQVNSHLPKKHEGTGLGLYLCQNLMKLHGGTIAVDSEFGKGTTVTVKFPPERTVKEIAANSHINKDVACEQDTSTAQRKSCPL